MSVEQGVPELSIVIPAYNEEAAVAGVIAAHRDIARPLARDVEILACDDGSEDGTWEAMCGVAADAPELRLLRQVKNRGIPATMKCLYAEARGDWISFAPADGQVPAAALEIMWRAREGAALVLISLVRRGHIVREVDIPRRPRVSGRAKGVTPLGALHAAVDVGRFMLRDLLGGQR